ncbi:MAG: OmpA family protein [Chitinispirillaceae bacterium]|nr:OmpA family protein [Chitinispirillaceae bacterium]
MCAILLKSTFLAASVAIFLPLFPLLGNDINTGGQKGIVRTLSTETYGKTGFTIGGAAKYGTELEYIAGPSGKGNVINQSTNRTVSRTNPHLISGNVFGAFGLTDFWDVAIDLPLYYDVTGWNKEKRSGIGDLELSTKMAYPFGRDSAWLTNAYALKVLLPTGSSNRGFFPRHVYYLTNSTMSDTDAVFALKTVYFNPQIIWSMDFGMLNPRLPLRLHFNLGGILATKKSNSAVVAAVGFEVTPHPVITFFTEISGESRVKWYTEIFSPRSFINDPFWVTPGVRFSLPKGLYVTLAGDIGIARDDKQYRSNFRREGYAYSTKSVPRYNAQFTFSWEGIGIPPDRDHDDIPDRKDLCIRQAEDIDGFEDADGCPDIDNDNDGIIDTRDSCPLEPAICSGCPILDADNDGINDDVDRCINDPEDLDGFSDTDGCPDPDNDNDGIVDTKDTCPDKAEDSDGFEDSDGCPDFDNDSDGIPDSSDKCPTLKGIPENDGCPKTEEIKRGKLILEGVNFESGKAVLTPGSYTTLNRVRESLAEWENVRCEIRGHTDNIGSEELNLRLSKARAEAVMEYLVRNGIEPSRLRAIGLGESAPVANNRTAEGRAMNRRVELQRID